MSAELQDTPADYVREGLVLVPIPRGSKGPGHKSWNRRENCITDPAQTATLRGNIGLAHAYSGTCCIDVDALDGARAWLAERGIDIDALLNAQDAVLVSSGRPNRAKLLYRIAAPLASLKLAGRALEFRCATRDGLTVQDLLPPSQHPSGQRYRWEYAESLVGHWSMLPPIPAALLALWKSLLSPQRSALAKGSAADGELSVPEPRAGLGFGELATLLQSIDPDVHYDNWLRVLMAVHHETAGSATGFELVNEWSAKGRKYRGTKEIRQHWNSFNPDRSEIVGAAWLRKFSVDQAAQNVGSRFTVIPDHRFIEREPLTWHIKGVLPKAELVVVYGASGSGKSFCAFDMTAAIATGKDWQGRRTTKGRVVYVIAEGATGFLNRLKAYAKTHGGRLPGLRIIADVPLLVRDNEHLLLARQIEASGGADVIVIDTLAACSPGADENAAKDMGRVIDQCKQLHGATGATVLLIHHSGKDESKGARGWSGLRAAVDAEIEISKCGHHRTITITKMKDGEDGGRFGFKLVQIEIGIDADGEPITSCTVEPLAAVLPSGRREPRPGSVERAVFDAVRESLAADGYVPVTAVVDAVLPQLRVPLGRDTRAQHVMRALRSLAARGFIAVEGETCRVL